MPTQKKKAVWLRETGQDQLSYLLYAAHLTTLSVSVSLNNQDFVYWLTDLLNRIQTPFSAQPRARSSIYSSASRSASCQKVCLLLEL